MTTASEDRVLRVHMDGEGKIWLGQYGVRAALANMTHEQFISHSVFKSSGCVRVMGVAENAPLLVGMYEAKLRHKGKSVKIHVVHPSGPLGEPTMILHQLWCPGDNRLRCHEMTPQDYAAYSLVAAHGCDLPNRSGRVGHILRCHPAYPALSFLVGADLQRGAEILAEIVDPRRFMHIDRPNRMTRLYRYMGLIPRVLRHDGVATETDMDRGCRAAAVYRCWRPEGAMRPSEADVEHNPRQFLWRIARADGRGHKAVLKGCQALLRFITLVWLQGLAPPGKLIFDPDMFFKTPGEAHAYRMHVGSKPDLGDAG